LGTRMGSYVAVAGFWREYREARTRAGVEGTDGEEHDLV